MMDAAARPVDVERLERLLLAALVGGIAVALIARLVLIVVSPDMTAMLANPALSDAALYRSFGQRILDGGQVYPPFQFNEYTQGEHLSLYPPPMVLFVIVPMSVLPEFLWWFVPLGVIAAVAVYHRPSLLGCLGILLCLAWPATNYDILVGNPVIWAAAFVALGTVWKGAAVLSLFKPSLAVFALVGSRSRSWLVWLAVYVVVALVMLPLWLDYFAALRTELRLNPLHSLVQLPTLLIPVIAYVTRTERSSPAPG